MSVTEHELAPDDELATRTGSRAPFTMVGDWILLAPLSAQAKLLYALLAAHVNVSDGARRVWPSRETLAGWLGLKQARSVDKYVVELEAIGAVVKEKQRGTGNMRARNTYVVNFEPPEGYDDHIRFTDYYRARRAERRAAEPAGQDDVRSSAPRSDQASTDVAAAEDEYAGHADVRSSALRSAPERGPVVRHTAQELDQNLNNTKGGAGGGDERPAGEPVPDRDAPTPQAPKAKRDDPSTWFCSEHLAALAVDPGADIPPCQRCKRVRQWGEAGRAEAEAERDRVAAAERRTVADRIRGCQMCDERGNVIDPDDGAPFLPAVRCDHETTTPEMARAAVEARIAETAAPPVTSSAEHRAAVMAEARRRTGKAPAARSRRRGEAGRPSGGSSPGGEGPGADAAVDELAS